MIFTDFYKRFGLRVLNHFMQPVMSEVDNFVFPQNTVLHTPYYDTVQVGPDVNYYFFKKITKQIPVYHIQMMTESAIGSPRKTGISINPEIQQFHLQNRRFRRATDPVSGLKDEHTLGVYNYGFLQILFRYTRSLFVDYYRWYNITRTFLEQFKNIPLLATKNNLLFVQLPTKLPTLSTLQRFEDIDSVQDDKKGVATEAFHNRIAEMLTPDHVGVLENGELGLALEGGVGVSTTMLKSLETPEQWLILELWKWLGKDGIRANSLFSLLTPQQIAGLNIVFVESGRFSIVNLGTLNQWRIDKTDKNNDGVYDPEKIQKCFLRYLVSVQASRVEPEVVTSEGELENVNKLHPSDEGEVEVELTKNQIAAKMLETMDEDLAAMDNIHARHLQDDLEKSESMDLITSDEVTSRTYKSHKVNWGEVKRVAEIRPERDVLQEQLDELADNAVISFQEHKALSKQIAKMDNLPSPLNDNKLLRDSIIVKPEELLIKNDFVIPKARPILDESMLKSSLHEFDSTYVKKIMPRHIVASVYAFQRAGVIINSYDIEKVDELMGSYEIHTIRVKPLRGKATTWRFKIQKMDKHGIFMSNGNEYRMRKQRGDVPIRKTAPDTVTLTSYYNKTFVGRSTKRVNDFASWFTNNIRAIGLDINNSNITNLRPGSVFDNELDAPRLYSILAQNFHGFEANGYTFEFNYSKSAEFFGEKILDIANQEKLFLIAKSDTDYLALDKNDTLYELDEYGDIKPLETLIEFLGFQNADAPIDFAEVKIFGKLISVGLILAYYFGFNKLLSILKASHRRVQAGQRMNLQENEYAIVFSDETYIFNRDEKLAAMVLYGFNAYAKAIKNYSVYTFDKPNVYYNVLENAGISNRYLVEIGEMIKLFVDPITKDILVEMKEPTTFIGLLLRSAEMLLTDAHPRAQDMRYMRIKGNERVAGAVYSELVKALRVYNSKPNKAISGIELHPYAVAKAVAQDPAVALISKINVIENIKEREAITYSGTGGRNFRSMTADTRTYDVTDMGMISEATKDSSDVAINTYFPLNPTMKTLTGLKGDYDYKKDGVSSLFSTSVLLAPGSDRDDPKRLGFVSIQNAHSIACDSYRPQPYRTGGEYVAAHQTTDLFATTAKQACTVVQSTETGVIVEYEDGTREGIEIGRRYGAAAGLTLPHNVISAVKVGDKLKPGQVIAYNTKFFEYDKLEPSLLALKSGIVVRTALQECSETYEDASMISREIANLLTTETTNIRDIVVTFKQQVHEVVAVGTEVTPESFLCFIEDETTSNRGMFDKQTIDTLRTMSALAPAAKTAGVVERIEVLYNGDREDMSNSLAALASVSDREINRRSRSTGKSGFNGNVGGSLRLEGDPLLFETAVIRFYITSQVMAGEGDKGVFCNQMKTVFSSIEEHGMYDEEGGKVDAVFSHESDHKRQVNSANEIGTTISLQIFICKDAAKLFRSLQ